MHHKQGQRRTIGQFLFAGKRKFVVTFLLLAVTAGLGVGFSQWLVVHGSGNAFGHGKNTATAQVDFFGITDGVGTPTAIGPNESGNVIFRLSNPDTNNTITVKAVAPTAGAVITKVGDPSCVADVSTFTLGNWTGNQVLNPLGSGSSTSGSLNIPLTTTDAFPICLAGSDFQVPVTATG